MSASQQASFPPFSLPVFSVGRDVELLSARENALANTGIAVHSLIPEQAEPAARESCPRLWVFCASVEIPTLVFLACRIRRHSPGSRLVLLERDSPAGVEASLFHRVIDRQGDMDALTSVIFDLAP